MNVYILIIDIDMNTLIYDISEFNLNNCIRVKTIISKKHLYLYINFFNYNIGKFITD